MLKIGHRGAKGYVAENTIDSFLKAFQLGAHGVELDIHLSKDGKAVVIHDETVDRTILGATGLVKHFTVTAIKKLGVPTLVEVVHVLPPNAFLNIEIKDPQAAAIVVDEVEQFISLKTLSYKNVVISSFDWEVLKEIKRINPIIQLGVLTEGNLEDAFALAKKIEAYSINPWFKLLTPAFVAKAHASQFQIHTFTVNSPEDITFVKNLGVDAIISDFPDRL